MTESQYYDEHHGLPTDGILCKVAPDLGQPLETASSTSTSSSPQEPQVDPSLNVLFGTTDQLLRLGTRLKTPSQQRNKYDTMMAEKADEPPPTIQALADSCAPQLGPRPESHTFETPVYSTSSDEYTPESSRDPQTDAANKQLVSRPRADSMQGDSLPDTEGKAAARSRLESPLRIKTLETDASTANLQTRRDSISASPTLAKHTKTAADGNGSSLPPFEPPSPSTASPQAERLPGIDHITSSLAKLAEAATQELPRHQHSFPHHHHSQSFGSAKSLSPVLANHAYPASLQASPQAYHPPNTAHSPTSTLGESSTYASPPAYLAFMTYTQRRSSMVDGVPPLVPNLPSASSSGESYGGYPSSGTEGYSTSHTTPIDILQTAESTPRPVLPPPPGMHSLRPPPPPPPIMVPGPFKCDVPNCTAGTFQTQYLLNSHKNVHSQSRPHYCPVAGCSRSEGGKGFKRKNEMIRHGLVHNSPGYICPFCPEREHRYPRPDNLQRHVRVHHVDKDRDDHVLRDVLNQRTEGQGKTRRRRTNPGPVMAAS